MPRRKNSEILKEKQKDGIVMKRAIRAKCLDCMNSQKIDCLVPDCPLYLFRPYQEK